MLSHAVLSLGNLLGPSLRANCFLLLGLGTGGSEGPRRTGVQGEEVAREAGSWRTRAGTGRVLRERVHLPPRERTPSEGVRDRLGSRLCGRRPYTLLGAEVAEPHVMEAAAHAQPPAVVLGGIVPDDLVASFALFHFCLGLRGWRGLARPTRPLQGNDLRAYLALLWLATRAHEMHLKSSVPLALMKWGPHILSSPSSREGRWHFLAHAGAWP